MVKQDKDYMAEARKEVEEAQEKVEKLKEIAKEKSRKALEINKAEEVKKKRMESLAKAREAKTMKEEILKSPLPVVEDGESREIKRGEKLSFRERLKLKRKIETTYLVTMLYANGTIRHYLIQTPKEHFVLNKKRYHLNKIEGGWYDINFHQTRLLFHENYVEPLDKEIMVKGEKSFLSITPENIEPFIEMEYVKVLSKSDLSKWIKMTLFFVALNLLFGFGMVIILVIQSGIFSGMLGGLMGG